MKRRITEDTETENKTEESKLMSLMGISNKGPLKVMTFTDGGLHVSVNDGIEDEDEEDEMEIDHKSFRSNKKNVNMYDEITGEMSDEYIRANPHTLKCKKVIRQRNREVKRLLENADKLDQYVVESFAYTYHGYEIAKRWSTARNVQLEYMDKNGVICVFDPEKTKEEDLPQWKYYCAFAPPFLGLEDEMDKEDEPPRIEGAMTRKDREERERKRPWYQHPNSLRSEDRICVLKILDKVIVQPYIEMMESIEGL